MVQEAECGQGGLGRLDWGELDVLLLGGYACVAGYNRVGI